MNDTIVAISTVLGIGAISIVRLSGKDSIDIVNSCFKGKDLAKVKSHTINYGHIVDKNQIIDEVLVSVMKSPKTYTTEDVVEINCHGGVIATKKVLEVILNNGARLAEPGEFTKRAFLNGRIDLVESEAIMDIISSKSEESRKLSINQIQGSTSKLITDFRNKLVNLLSSIEVNIDYPEYYDIEVITREKVRNEIKNMKTDLSEIIRKSEDTVVIKDGIKTVIVGKPNVGKSSILNSLLEQEKAIVTDIAGTTRDIVEGEIYLDGILLNIIDTAGIRKTADIVEKIGVEKSLNAIEEADLVLLVLNNNEQLTEEDVEILQKTANKNRIIIINKVDLTKKVTLPKNISDYIEMSIKQNIGMNELKEKIKELFDLEKLHSKNYTYLSNIRQISLAKKALNDLLEAEKSLENDLPIDMIEIDLKNCFEHLGEIIGITYDEELIDNLFKNFCVGK